MFLLREELLSCWDATIFVDVEPLIVAGRARDRDQREGRSATGLDRLYGRRYLPAQRRYLMDARPREVADAVVGNDDLAAPELVLRSG